MQRVGHDVLLERLLRLARVRVRVRVRVLSGVLYLVVSIGQL